MSHGSRLITPSEVISDTANFQANRIVLCKIGIKGIKAFLRILKWLHKKIYKAYVTRKEMEDSKPAKISNNLYSILQSLKLEDKRGIVIRLKHPSSLDEKLKAIGRLQESRSENRRTWNFSR